MNTCNYLKARKGKNILKFTQETCDIILERHINLGDITI